MKKFVAVLVLLLVCVAAAKADEPFVFDGKITWNSTFSDVVAAYGDYVWLYDVGFVDAYGNMITDDGSKGILQVLNKITFEGVDRIQSGRVEKENLVVNIIYPNFCVAGIPNCQLSFVWMREFMFTTMTPDNMEESELEAAYERISRALITKYGKPDLTENDKLQWNNVGDNTRIYCRISTDSFTGQKKVMVTYSDGSKRYDPDMLEKEVPTYIPNTNGI